MTFANVPANQHAWNFLLFSYTAVCISAFDYIFLLKATNTDVSYRKIPNRPNPISWRGKTEVSLNILKRVQQPWHCYHGIITSTYASI